MISTAPRHPFPDVSVEAFSYVPVTITRDEKDAVLRALRLLGAARPGGYHTCEQVIAALDSTLLRGRYYPEFRVRPILNALEADNAVVTVPDSGGGARGWQAARGDGDGLAAVSRRIGDRALAPLTGKRPDAGAVLRR